MAEDQALVNPALRPVFFILGWLSLVLGFVGAFLPVLPTTPFLILSAFLFSKSSVKLHQWILSLPTFGPMIKDWEQNKVIRPKAKAMSVTMLSAAIWASIIWGSMAIGLKAMLAAIWLGVGTFILTRKSA